MVLHGLKYYMLLQISGLFFLQINIITLAILACIIKWGKWVLKISKKQCWGSKIFLTFFPFYLCHSKSNWYFTLIIKSIEH